MISKHIAQTVEALFCRSTRRRSGAVDDSFFSKNRLFVVLPPLLLLLLMLLLLMLLLLLLLLLLLPPLLLLLVLLLLLLLLQPLTRLFSIMLGMASRILDLPEICGFRPPLVHTFCGITETMNHEAGASKQYSGVTSSAGKSSKVVLVLLF